MARGRLTPDDTVFVAMEQVLGLPVVNQCVWVLGRDVDSTRLDEFAGRLRRGRLSRLVVRTRPPTRDRWVFTPRAGEVVRETTPIASHRIEDWARAALHRGGIDSVAGPAWRLTTAPTIDGGTVVSLVSSHVVGDGAAVVAGVTEAVWGTADGLLDVGPPTVAQSVADGASVLVEAGRAVVDLVRHRAPDRRESPGDIAVPAGAQPAPLVTLTVDAAEFDAAAARRRGTANTLFAAVVLGVLRESGRVADGARVPITVPMAASGLLDLRANATTAATVTAVVDPGRYDDLGPLRAASKEAFAEVGQTPDPVASLAALAQALPDAVIRRLASGTGTPLCLASNLGALPDEFAGLGGAPVPVAMRSTTVGTTAEQLARAGGGVSAWAARSAGVITLSFASLDPVLLPDAATLRESVTAELGRYGVAARDLARTVS